MHPHTARPGLPWRRLLAALLIAGPLAMPSGAQAQATNTFTVNSTDDKIDIAPGDGICAASGSGNRCTLRAAIMEANSLGGAQTIRMPGGIYRLTIPGIDDEVGLKGDLDIRSDMTILGISSSARPIIDGNGLDRVFHVQGLTNSVRLQNLSVRGGVTSDKTEESDAGGGILTETSGRVTISNSLITSNRANGGGGISGRFDSKLTIEFSNVQNNQGFSGGGGIEANGQITILASSIDNNTARSGAGVDIGSSGMLAMLQSTISNNTAIGSGSTLLGGGVFIDAPGRASIANSTISGNSAAGGGGIYVRSQNSTARSLQLSSVTLTRNTGGGIAGDTASSISASGSIIASNSGGDCRLTVIRISGSRNLVGDNSCTLSGISNQTNTNPFLGSLALNGGPTRTHKPLSGSTAVDRGGSTCPTLDQRGTRRPQGGSCDIGAFETPSNVFLGTPRVALPLTAMTAGQTSTLMLSWTVPPTMTWTDLHTVDFQLGAGEEQPLVVRFSQGVTTSEELIDADAPAASQALTPTDTLTLFDSSGVATTGEIGANALLESAAATLDLGQSRLTSDGADGQTVTLTLALRLDAPLAGKRFATTLVATDDAGNIQGPDAVGTLAVGPFNTFLSLTQR